MVASSRKPAATVEDLVARGNYDRLEIISGEIVDKALPSFRHSLGEGSLRGALHPYTGRGGPRGPGGWWILTEVHVEYETGELYCHDLAGWRRDKVATPIETFPVRVAPDWVCEIVSPTHEKTDFVTKPRVLHRAKVPHYCMLHPEERVLLVQRWSPDGYVTVQQASAGETVRAEPFAAIEIRVGELFGDDE
jgi:Uma2 family endonuclease